MFRFFTYISITLILGSICAVTALAQSTAFSYQGKLRDGGMPANSLYDMEFRLFDAESGGSQVGSTNSKPGVSVLDGVFTVNVDFGAAFPGADRWLEIAVSPAGANNFTTLAPRQKVNSVPQSILAGTAKGLECLACVTDEKIDSVSGSKVSGSVAQASNADNLNNLPASRYVQTDTNGNVGIGAAPGAGSKLTVGGQIELTSGAIKFPDSTTQSTAGLTSVATRGPITGNGTAGSPLGIQSPLAVKSVDNPAQQPFFVNTANQNLVTLYLVPAGKRLVIEHVSGAVRANTSQGVPQILVGANDLTPVAMLLHQTSRDNGDGTTTWFFSSQTKTYVPAGKFLAIYYLTILNFTAQELRINGHLVDVQ